MPLNCPASHVKGLELALAVTGLELVLNVVVCVDVVVVVVEVVDDKTLVPVIMSKYFLKLKEESL